MVPGETQSFIFYLIKTNINKDLEGVEILPEGHFNISELTLWLVPEFIRWFTTMDGKEKGQWF